MFGVFVILRFNVTGIYFDYIPWFTAFTTKISLFKNYGLAAFGIIEPLRENNNKLVREVTLLTWKNKLLIYSTKK